MAPTKNRSTLRMNYSTCAQSCIIFVISGLPDFPCELRGCSGLELIKIGDL